MRSKFLLRNVVVVLAGFNLLFGLWNGGGLGFLGLEPKPVQEPGRLENQKDPELLILKKPQPETTE
jgi:hypothetical protein